MILAGQQFARSDAALRQYGYMALVESLGYADAIRFLTQISAGQGDYVEQQQQIVPDVSVDELYEQARQHWLDRQERPRPPDRRSRACLVFRTDAGWSTPREAQSTDWLLRHRDHTGQSSPLVQLD
jgi:hypothetical protein